MNFIVNTNVLLSALIRDSLTRQNILESKWQFYYPEISFHEVKKYKQMVMSKANLKEEEYNIILNELLKKIVLIPDEVILSLSRKSETNYVRY